VHHLALFIGWRFDCLITITWPTSAWPARKPILLSFATTPLPEGQVKIE